jgi:hypothetical protein
LKAIREMIIKLSKIINNDPPYWLREGYDDLPPDSVTNFFEINIKR